MRRLANKILFLFCITAIGMFQSAFAQQTSFTSSQASSTVAQPTFAKLFNDSLSMHKYWNLCDVVQSTVDSGYVCVGWYLNATSSKNVIQYFKLDKNGNIVWSRELPEYTSANVLKIVKSQNGYLLSLTYNGSAIMEIDEQGNKLWGKSFSSPFESFIIANSGGYIGIGGSILIKIDYSGNLLWQQQINSNLYPSTMMHNNILQDENDNIYLFGCIT